MESRSLKDDRVKFPPYIVMVIILFCLLPLFCNALGFDFGIYSKSKEGLAGYLSSNPELYSDSISYTLSGNILHAILVWSTLCIAIFIVILAIIYNRAKHDLAIPIIAVALLSTSLIDGFQVLSAGKLINKDAAIVDLIPITWAASQLLNALIMIIGTSLFLIKKKGKDSSTETEMSFTNIVIKSVISIIAAYLITVIIAKIPQLPTAIFADSIISRPWDVAPLTLFIIAGLFIYPQFYERHPGLFSHSLTVSVIPQVAAEFNMVFGSTALFDNSFNIAHFLKIVSYLIPLGGLIMDYHLTYQRVKVANDEILVEIAERTKVEKNLKIQYDVTKILAESASLNEAAPKIIQTICESINWMFGCIWMVDKESDELKNIVAWHLPGAQVDEFAETSRNFRFKKDEGLPGRVWGLAKPAWIPDVLSDTNFPRAKYITREPLHSAFAFPILSDGEIIGVIEFFSHEIKEPDKELLDMISALGSQIGQFIKRKEWQEVLAKQAEELKRSNTDLEQFAYVASHDLQEPLRMVSSYTNLLGKRYKGRLDSDADEFIEFAIDGAKRMQELINDLLEYSRVGTRGRAFEPVDCKDLVNRLVNNLKFTIEEKHAKVLFNGLPTVYADSIQLGQLFQNLISNAIKYNEADSPTVEIDVQHKDKNWFFSIKDNGIGIDPEYYERIFIIFQRLHTRNEYPGTGIGLAICKRIIERHGGNIWVESLPKKGTTFFFTIPDRKAG